MSLFFPYNNARSHKGFGNIVTTIYLSKKRRNEKEPIIDGKCLLLQVEKRSLLFADEFSMEKRSGSTTHAFITAG